MTTETRSIEYRGGIARFRIPAHWAEEHDPDGNGEYFDPKTQGSYTCPTDQLGQATAELALLEREVADARFATTLGESPTEKRPWWRFW